MTVHELQELWSELDMTVEEGITELSTISNNEVNIGEVTYNQIPQPRVLGKKLLSLAKVTLPDALPCRNINVSTREKLGERRKTAIT